MNAKAELLAQSKCTAPIARYLFDDVLIRENDSLWKIYATIIYLLNGLHTMYDVRAHDFFLSFFHSFIAFGQIGLGVKLNPRRMQTINDYIVFFID